MAIGQKLRLRLFLEGIEVPIIGAAIQANINSPATASIQVIPTDRILELKPRTMVHIFYWDFNNDLPTLPYDAQGDTPIPDLQVRGYRLAFMGEVVGLAFMKTPGSRQAILQCADFSTYWDTTYQVFISYSPNGNFLADSSSTYGGGNSMFDNISSSHSGVMNSLLNSRPKTEGLTGVQGLMGGIISLLEAMGGVPNHVSGINDFFTIAELKNHLLQQITAEQNDNTAQALFDSQAFSEWLNRGVTSLGELVSFRDMLKLLFHWVYYEVVPITSPYFIKAVPPTTSEKVQISKAQQNAYSLSASQRLAIRNFIQITTRYDGTAGVQPTITNQVNADERSAAADLAKKIKQLLGGPQGNARPDVQFSHYDGATVTTVAYEDPPTLPEAKLPDAVKKALNFIIDQKTNIKPISGKFTLQQLLTISQANVNPKATSNQLSSDLGTLQDNQRLWKQFTQNLIKCLGDSASTTRSTKTKTPLSLSRCQTQIFRPDCFFVAPPRCNVLFPDQYTSFQYQRNFLQEITRLRLSVGLEFISGHDSGLLTPIYFSPSNISVSQDLAKRPGSSGIRTLLPWEKYTGILPKFESISEVNYMANKRQQTLQKNVKGQGAAYSQRAADFNFLKYRFSPRTLSVSAKFTPQFVLGFPGVVIDRPFTLSADQISQAVTQAGVGDIQTFDIKDILANISVLGPYFKAPTQYLGMPATLLHNIDQAGGTTNITFTHARTHRLTDDDFLASYAAEVIKKTQKQTVSTVLDADEILRSGDYKKLRFLIDATPQDLIVQATDDSLIQFEDDNGNPLDVADAEPELDLRPNGAPSLASLDQLAPAIFATPNPSFSQGSKIQPSSIAFSIPGDTTDPIKELLNRELPGDQFIRWVGPTVRAQLKGTRTSILTPNPYTKIKPGSPGLKNGVISQIQLLSNSVVAVSSADIAQFAQTKQDRADLASRRKNAGKDDRIFLWRKAVIWEDTTTQSTATKIPVEETIRPPWFSPLYSNLFIGDNIYQPFFGTGSIVDEGLFVTPDGGAIFGAAANRDEVLAEVNAANGDAVQISKILDKYKAQTVGSIPSIESAVDALAYLYGEVQRQGLDVQKFIVNYTDRPIATMEDILGSLDLEYEVQGDKLVKTSGVSGFHSTAVAPFGSLLGLLDNPDEQLARIHKTGKKFPISTALDPRPGRRAAVEAYANDFGSTGALGVGLRG